MSGRLAVLDASVGVKWFREEAGSDAARGLLRGHAAGTLRIVVPSLFFYEVIDVARRHFGIDVARRVWQSLAADEIVYSNPDADLLERTLEIAAELGCTLYDAAAPALADHLECPLYSADRKAHGALPGVVIVG